MGFIHLSTTLSLLFVWQCIHTPYASAEIYQLSYDAILDSDEIGRLEEEYLNFLTREGGNDAANPAPNAMKPLLAKGLGRAGVGGLEDVMTKIQENIIDFWKVQNQAREDMNVAGAAQVECFPNSISKKIR